MGALAVEGEAGGVDRLDAAHRVALDAGDLHEAADGIAGQAEIVFHADFCGALDLLRGASEKFRQGSGSH